MIFNIPSISTFLCKLYLNSLPDDIEEIDVSNRNLTILPSLTRFRNLKRLYCNNNRLTVLPSLNENLEIIWCQYNKLTILPPLNENLKELHCNNNLLTSLPHLNENLEILWCADNLLITLPSFNINLHCVYCHRNNLMYLPSLNNNLQTLWCKRNRLTYLPLLNNNLSIVYDNNPICEIINGDKINIINTEIQILTQFRSLYYSLKFKKQFRDWLWIKVIEPKIIKKYHPSYLIDNLHEDTNLDELLNNW